MSPRVSVIMPARNAARTVAAAASSVLWQDFADLELVVVDDGSTDDTAEIAAALGPRVRVVSQPPLGVAAARNAGIAEARGELFTFCDADDLLFESHVRALVELHARRGGLVTANAYWLLPGGISRGRLRHAGRFPPPHRQRTAILQHNFVSIMTLFHRDLPQRIGGFDESLRRAEDWDFWMRAVLGGEVVTLQPRPLALCRWGTTGLSSSVTEMDTDVERVLRKALGRPDLRARERSYLQARLESGNARELLRNAEARLSEGRYREAAALFRKAAALFSSDRRLVYKSALLSAAPPLAGPLLRLRERRRREALGMDDHHVR